MCEKCRSAMSAATQKSQAQQAAAAKAAAAAGANKGGAGGAKKVAAKGAKSPSPTAYQPSKGKPGSFKPAPAPKTKDPNAGVAWQPPPITPSQPSKPPEKTEPEVRFVDLEFVDADGNAIPKALYRLTDAAGHVFSGRTDESGAVRVKGIADGACQVELVDEPVLEKSSAALSSPKPAAAAAPEPAKGADWIELAFTDADGSPSKEADFKLIDAAGKTHRGRTDAHGKARLTGLAPGACRVQLDA